MHVRQKYQFKSKNYQLIEKIMIKSKNKPSENELIKEELGIKLMTAKHPLIKKLKEYPISIHETSSGQLFNYGLSQ